MTLTKRQKAIVDQAVKNNEYATIESATQQMKCIVNAMKTGKILAKVDHVSTSGMTRHISFYYIYKGRLCSIANTWIGRELFDYTSRANGWTMKRFYKVQGCGMDMIFNTLYNWHYQLFSKRLDYSKTTKYNTF